MDFVPLSATPQGPRADVWISDPGAQFRPSSGTFVTGNDPDAFGRMPLDQAANTLQAPIGHPNKDELDPIEASLRAREAQNRLALIESRERDPDYQFLRTLAGMINEKSVERIATHIDTSTELMSIGGQTSYPLNLSTVSGGTALPITINYGVKPSSVGTKWILNADVKSAYDGAVNELCKVSYNNLYTSLPSWARQIPGNDRDVFCYWLQNSREVSTTFCQLIASKYGMTLATVPKKYTPASTRANNAADGNAALSTFQFQVRWATNGSEAIQRGGALLMGELKIPTIDDLSRSMYR